MPRMTAGKRSELESFWRAHLEGWRRSDLNQREYCELHGLPLKRFGNWRATLKHEEPASAGKLLYRRGGGLKHMSKHLLKEISSAPSGYIPSARSGGSGMVSITHNVRHALAVGDRSKVLNRGKTLGTVVRGEITPEEPQDLMEGGQKLASLERSLGRSVMILFSHM